MNSLVCLDLEGTLISNAVSQIPRPGLYNFLQQISAIADVILYTSVSRERTEAIKRILVSEGSAPEWFLKLGSMHPEATIKSKQLVPDISKYSDSVLVDDQRDVIADGEFDWWVPVVEFQPPYSVDDRELERVLGVIRERTK
ncbi:NIF family HAD-type phosphatase [Marinobacter sp. M5B]|uniref:NIF family HAD-type phosphatase n=1 Tax=Marinobacter sp. M5B TaxID=3141535 RepID=UPI0036D40096